MWAFAAFFFPGLLAQSSPSDPITSLVTTQAVVTLIGDGTDVQGTIQFEQTGGQGAVRITGNVTGLIPGNHGFHVHQFGTIIDGCDGAGPNLEGTAMGTIDADDNGVASIDYMDGTVSLNGDEVNIVGRALVVHEFRAPDMDPNEQARRIACGVIGVAAQEQAQ